MTEVLMRVITFCFMGKVPMNGALIKATIASIIENIFTMRRRTILSPLIWGKENGFLRNRH